MKTFVFWTGMANVLVGVALQFSGVAIRLAPAELPGMAVRLFGALAFLIGVMVVICSRDLKHRGTLVAWEGILRLVGFTILTGYGVFSDGGFPMTLAGIGDGLIGLAYLVALPRHLGVSLPDLLLDRKVES